MDDIAYRYDSGWVMPYLSPGESILWQGRPQRFTPFTENDIFMIPFSLFWCGTLFPRFLEDIKDGIGLFGLFFIPFVLVGLYVLFGRLVVRWFLLRHTAYAITTRKILRRRNRKVEVLQGDPMPPFRVKEHRNGLKSVLFKENLYSAQIRRRPAWEPGFALEFLSDAERALRAIDAVQTGFDQ